MKCLSCIYEPKWTEPTGKEYPRRSGECRFQIAAVVLPACATLAIKPLVRYSDDSGLPTKCPAYIKKTDAGRSPANKTAR